MIRAATTADLPALHAMAFAMWAEAPALRDVPLDPVRVDRVATALIEDGTVLVQGAVAVGFIAFAVYNDPWTGLLCASEQALYLRPEFRGAGIALRLVQEAVTVARTRGCAWFTSGTSTGTAEEATSVTYGRAGFDEVGRQYRKALARVPAAGVGS